MTIDAEAYWVVHNRPIASEEQKQILDGARLTVSAPGGYLVWYGGSQVVVVDNDWRTTGTIELRDASARFRQLLDLHFHGEVPLC